MDAKTLEKHYHCSCIDDPTLWKEIARYENENVLLKLMQCSACGVERIAHFRATFGF